MGGRFAGAERGVDILTVQRTYRRGDKAGAEVAFRRKVASGTARDGGVMRQVDGIRDHRGGSIGHGGAAGQHGDAVGDAQRMRAPAPARGGYPAHGVGSADRDPVGRAGAGGDGAGQAFAGVKVQCDVAAIVGIGTGDAGAGEGRENRFGHRTGYGGHGGDESWPERQNCGLHAKRDGAEQGGLWLA